MKIKIMSKTWETLFNLSSFMKYLLSRDLPDEDVEAPSYVLDSLYDLLTVTSAWIDKIKPEVNANTLLSNKLAEHSAQVILSSKSNKSNEGNKSHTNFKEYDYSNASRSAPPPSELSSKKFHKSKIASMENSSQEIPDIFIMLSKEMVNGRPFGFYCRPCDEAFFSKKEWDKHMGDRLHSFLMDCDIKYGACVYCKFIIFARNRDINKLFKYHETEHNLKNYKNSPIKGNIYTNETNKIHSISNENDFVKTNWDVTSRVDDIDNNYNLNTSKGISPVFIELDKKMHSGQEKGFYCHICDKAFEVVTEWNMHFQKAAVHSDQYDSSGCFEMCESCSLVIFAVPSIQKWYKAHHKFGHYCVKEETKTAINFKSSVESLQSTAQSLENLQSYKNNPSYQNNQSTNTYKITQQFVDFNEKIHSENLRGHFYCRPCNATLNPEEWNKHSTNKKHGELMASRKFKNWKGVCTYCAFTIIGTHDTVKYYMEFHSEQHNKVVSYDFQKISSFNIPSNHPRRKNRGRKVTSPNSGSTFGDEEDGSDSEDKQSIIKNEPGSVSPNRETSWYTSSREEQLNDSIRQLIDSRAKEKYTSGNPQFGALCTLCEYTNNNAFDWQDHLSSDGHCKRQTPQDRQGYLSDLNIYLFAHMSVFEKYKSLVKGNWSFID